MADNTLNVGNGVQDQTKAVSRQTQISDLKAKVKGSAGSALSTVDSWAIYIGTKVQTIVDRFVPPEQRAQILANLQAFMTANPKLSIFLGMNFLLTGVPLVLFVVYSISVFLSSLVVGLIIGILAAVFFTLVAVGVALAIVLPTVFLTTGTACFLFLWGLGTYYILRWASGGKLGINAPAAPEGEAIGDKLNGVTGGRLTGFMDNARAQRAKKDNASSADTAVKHESPNSNI